MGSLEGPVPSNTSTPTGIHGRRQSAYSNVARSAMIMSATNTPPSTAMTGISATKPNMTEAVQDDSHLMPAPPRPVRPAIPTRVSTKNNELSTLSNPDPAHSMGLALTDTPISTAPSSPNIKPWNQSLHAVTAPVSGASTPKTRATTLDIPGLTRSKASPDGIISQRDIGAKLVIIMVGLPARGKSYIVKKIRRYLRWLQHPTEVFNVGERRRVVAGKGQPTRQEKAAITQESKLRESVGSLQRKMSMSTGAPTGIIESKDMLPPPMMPTRVLVNGQPQEESSGESSRAEPELQPLERKGSLPMPPPEKMDQSANFFDPTNTKALHLREQIALETLDELLDYILLRNGSVGILDATNSTLERRKVIMEHIRERGQGKLNVLFLESQCIDEGLLERNMHLKLFGPDYKGQDPVAALTDFKKRVEMYQKSYLPLGEFEEKNNMSYVQVIDVGRKVISHQIKGFLSLQTVSYLMNFNLAPRQIWITRHGESQDNTTGRLGGDSSLTEKGRHYAEDLTKFMTEQWALYEKNFKEKQDGLIFPPRPGDATPPNPEWSNPENQEERHFCVWTSMLKRSIETAQYFNEEDFDVKQMKMLDEINAGAYEGMTYRQIQTLHTNDYEQRKIDKLQYRYPGLGGESYLDVINRLQKVIIEIERMTDHVLIIGHRSVTRILLAYFLDMERDKIAHIDCPLGVVYMLEPKPYGVEFKAFCYDEQKRTFQWVPDYQLKASENPTD